MNNKGFTLVEVLLTIAIFLIVGGLSSPFYARFLIQNNVSNVVDQLSGQLRKAQIYSMMGRQNGSWGVTINSGAIILYQGTSFVSRNSAFHESNRFTKRHTNNNCLGKWNNKKHNNKQSGRSFKIISN